MEDMDSKIVYLKIRDPITSLSHILRPNEVPQFCEPIIISMAGLLVFEDEEKVVIGHVCTKEDNEVLEEVLDTPLPHVTDLTVITKNAIVTREDFTRKGH